VSPKFRKSEISLDTGSVFSQIFDSGPGSDRKEKRRTPPESTPALRIRCHLCLEGCAPTISLSLNLKLADLKAFCYCGQMTACQLAIAPVAEVGPDPDYRSRLRQDSDFFFRTRIRTCSEKFV